MGSAASKPVILAERAPETPQAERALKLLLCALQNGRGEAAMAQLQAILRSPVDWQSVLWLADHHRVSHLLIETLSSVNAEIPADVLATLRIRYQTNVQRSLLLAGELLRVLDCLSRQGIEAIPYKGVALSELSYGDMALRQAGDNDVFVRRRDVMRAKDAVAALGYTPREPLPEAAEQDYLSYGYEWTFDAASGQNLLELHWALEPRFYSIDYDMDGLFARASKATVAGREVKTPSPEDLVLVLSIHAAKHAWERLIWLCDIARVVHRENLSAEKLGRPELNQEPFDRKTLNWEWIRLQARDLGVERIVHVSLLLVENLLGTELPQELQRELDSDREAQRFAKYYSERLAAGTPNEALGVAYFRQMIELRERASDRWKFLSRLAFDPGPGEWKTVKLPRALRSFYPLVRMARLAARFGRG